MKNEVYTKLLTDVEIVKKLTENNKEARIIISPIVNIQEQLDICSFDLRLGTEFILYEKNIHTSIDPLQEWTEWDIQKTFRRTKRVNPVKPFVIHPGEQILGSTLEYIRFPSNIFGLLSGRSSWSRQGLAVHSTAEFIHPNTSSIVTLELQNHGPVPIKLYTGMRIAQISFFELNRECNKKACWKEPKYINNYRTEYGKIWKDKEFHNMKFIKNRRIINELKERLLPSLKEFDGIQRDNLIREFESIAQDILLKLYLEEKL